MLLFVDNIFRFTQAGSEVSALLGRIPSAVGYQPTLATDMGLLQERITSTGFGSITSVQVRASPSAPSYHCSLALSHFHNTNKINQYRTAPLGGLLTKQTHVMPQTEINSSLFRMHPLSFILFRLCMSLPMILLTLPLPQHSPIWMLPQCFRDR